MKKPVARFRLNITKDQCREFGLVIILVMSLLGIYRHEEQYLRFIVVLVLITMLLPIILYPFAWLWFGMGKILGKISSALLLVLIYFGIVLPVGLIRKMAGYDPLKLKQFKKSNRSVMADRNHIYEESDLLHTF